MNPGYIIGIVLLLDRPVEGALIGLDWVVGGDQQLPIYRPAATVSSGSLGGRGLTAGPIARSSHLWTETDAEGFFNLSFVWRPEDIVIAMFHPHCQIFMQIYDPVTRTMHLHPRRPDVAMIPCTRLTMDQRMSEMASRAGAGRYVDILKRRVAARTSLLSTEVELLLGVCRVVL
jgi:hypothetical protein